MHGRAPTMRGMSPLRIVLTLVLATTGEAPSERQVALMIREADAIWRPHGVAVALEGRGGPALPIPGAELPLALRFADPPAARLGRLGAVRLVHGVPERSLDIVAADVSTLVGQAVWHGRRVDEWPATMVDQIKGRALGRVLAHELGHFLLASPVHTRIGLMRAGFTARDLASADRRPFQVNREYLPRLGARLDRLRPSLANAALEQP